MLRPARARIVGSVQESVAFLAGQPPFDALGDAITTGAVLLALASPLERAGRDSARELYGLSRRDAAAD